MWGVFLGRWSVQSHLPASYLGFHFQPLAAVSPEGLNDGKFPKNQWSLSTYSLFFVAIAKYDQTNRIFLVALG